MPVANDCQSDEMTVECVQYMVSVMIYSDFFIVLAILCLEPHIPINLTFFGHWRDDPVHLRRFNWPYSIGSVTQWRRAD